MIFRNKNARFLWKNTLINQEFCDILYKEVMRGMNRLKTLNSSLYKEKHWSFLMNYKLIDSEKYKDIKYGIKLCNKNIGFNGKFYIFPYFLTFLLKRYLKESK